MQPAEKQSPWYLLTDTDSPGWCMTHTMTCNTKASLGNVPLNPCTHEGVANVLPDIQQPRWTQNPPVPPSSLQQGLTVLPRWESSCCSFKLHLTPLWFPKTHPSTTLFCPVLQPSWTVFILFLPIIKERDTSFDFLWAILRVHLPSSAYYHLWNQFLPGGITDTFSGICDCSHTVSSWAKQLPSAKQHDWNSC